MLILCQLHGYVIVHGFSLPEHTTVHAALDTTRRSPGLGPGAHRSVASPPRVKSEVACRQHFCRREGREHETEMG